MYYKIENKECELYKKLHELRSQELVWEKENKEAICAKIGLKWDKYLGHRGQQNFKRTTTYSGFIFKEPEKVDPKVWIKHKSQEGGFVPNTRTKAGKEMAKFLNETKGHWFNMVFYILGLEHPCGRFTFPYVEICGDVIVIFMGSGFELTNDFVIEITSKEFESLRSVLA